MSKTKTPTKPTPTEINWPEITRKLPHERTPEAKALRDKLFDAMDPNANGFLSLAEVDRGIRDVLCIDALFDAKPAIMRAFQAAKNVDKKTKSKLGPDFVERSEFRILLLYLRQYFEYFVMFQRIDPNNDRRIDFGEFQKAVKQLEIWGVKISDPAAEFKKVDKNRGGYILFDEFADWAFKNKLDLEDDDD